MPPRRRTFQRPLGHRRYRTLFIIAVEGRKTEQQYFDMLQCQQSVVQVSRQVILDDESDDDDEDW